MERVRLIIIALIVSCSIATANDHHYRRHRHPHHHWTHGGHGHSYYPVVGQSTAIPFGTYSPYVQIVSPVVVRSSVTPFPVTGFVSSSSTVPVFVSTGPAWLPAIIPAASLVTVHPLGGPADVDAGIDPAKLPAKPSTAAGRVRSLGQTALGDDKLRKGLWAQAYVNYRSAVDAAGDQGTARLRLGFCYAAVKHYTSAVREFKRGLFLDPDLAASGISLPILFGPDSEVVRTSIVHNVAEWVREDLRDSDRWFLLGLLLHFEGDERARRVLETARQLSPADHGHLTALLDAEYTGNLGEGKPAWIPELPPAPNNEAELLVQPNAALPPLSDRPMPLVVPNP